jgi:hypothetical protein
MGYGLSAFDDIIVKLAFSLMEYHMMVHHEMVYSQVLHHIIMNYVIVDAASARTFGLSPALSRNASTSARCCTARGAIVK